MEQGDDSEDTLLKESNFDVELGCPIMASNVTTEPMEVSYGFIVARLNKD